MQTGKKLWSTRWDLKDGSGWETEVMATRGLWPDHWKEEQYFVVPMKGGAVGVLTALDDVILFATGDDELSELHLEEYLHHVSKILNAMKKKESLSKFILQEYPEVSTALFRTVSPGGRVAYTVPPE